MIDYRAIDKWGDWRTLDKEDAPTAWLIGATVLDIGEYWVTEEGEWIDPETGEAPDAVS